GRARSGRRSARSTATGALAGRSEKPTGTRSRADTRAQAGSRTPTAKVDRRGTAVSVRRPRARAAPAPRRGDRRELRDHALARLPQMPAVRRSRWIGRTLGGLPVLPPPRRGGTKRRRATGPRRAARRTRAVRLGSRRHRTSLVRTAARTTRAKPRERQRR